MRRVKSNHQVVQLGRLLVAHYGRRWWYIHGRLLTDGRRAAEDARRARAGGHREDPHTDRRHDGWYFTPRFERDYQANPASVRTFR